MGSPPGQVIADGFSHQCDLPSRRAALLAAHQTVERFARIVVNAVRIFSDRRHSFRGGGLDLAITQGTIRALLLGDEGAKLFGLLQQIFAGRRKLIDR